MGCKMVDIAPGVEISRLPILMYAFMFIIYLALHITFGYLKKKSEEALERVPNNDEILKQVKMYSLIFKYFPAIAVILIVGILYSL